MNRHILIDSVELEIQFNMDTLFYYNDILAAQGDFLVNDYILEVGGRKKGNQQLETAKNGYVVSDDLLTGAGNKIPLWIFGLLY